MLQKAFSKPCDRWNLIRSASYSIQSRFFYILSRKHSCGVCFWAEVKGEENISSNISFGGKRGRRKRGLQNELFNYQMRGLNKEPLNSLQHFCRCWFTCSLSLSFMIFLLCFYFITYSQRCCLIIWSSAFCLNLQNTLECWCRDGLNGFSNLGAQALICWLNWFPVTEHCPNQFWVVTFG